jgi:hypothetical protein
MGSPLGEISYFFKRISSFFYENNFILQSWRHEYTLGLGLWRFDLAQSSPWSLYFILLGFNLHSIRNKVFTHF